jgi:Na+-translocating ferredoxin:NAD+ oxidoreductase RnfC subunit
MVIANGAECEPLLSKDQALMEHHAAEILEALMAVMHHVGASQGAIAVKNKNRSAIAALTQHLTSDVRIVEMEDVYPAGDEYEVVYNVTGKTVPTGGYPTDIGFLVQNVETLYNIHRATLGFPVTHSMVTVHGNVSMPYTAWLPIGMCYGDAVEVAGGANISDWVIIDGGPMMGIVTADLTTPVTRVSSGITVVPRDSFLALRKAQHENAMKRVGKSACDQCSLCTELCPRYLLGYPVQPHLVMRSLALSGVESRLLSHWAQACCECNVCSLWACPEGLDPRGVCAAAKEEMRSNEYLLPREELQRLTREVHPLKAYRGVPTARLVRRLGLSSFTEDAPLKSMDSQPQSVAIPLLQHAGLPAVPTVSEGDTVKVGDVIGKAAEEGLSLPIHASIDGIVRSVAERIVLER